MTLVRRGNRKATGPFVVDADALPQTIDVVRTRAEAMGIEVVVADLADGLPEGELSRRAGAVPRRLRPGPRPAPGDRGRPRARRARRRRRRPAGADPARGARRRSAPTSSSAPPSASASRCSTAARTPASWRSPPGSSGTCRAGWSASRSTPRAARRTGSRCRPASSTSAATRRPPTSAPPRCCWPSSPRCTPSTTAPRGCGRSRPAPTGTPPCWPARSPRAGVDGRARASSSTPSPSPSRAGRPTWSRPRASAALHLRLVDADRVGHLDLGGHHPGDARPACSRRSASPAADARPGRSTRPPATRCPRRCAATTPYLTHEVFSTHHSETAMLRYLRRLSARDYALDRGMIPLGSCTMKLNATTEMEPVSLPGFADLHPFAPAEDAAGYRQLVEQLEGWLAEVTGYDRVSIQPNAGSQGELAGLLAIRGYHRASGEGARDVCLIPSSAHGTNAASAVMAGMKVVVVKAADDGSVDLDDLRAQCEAHADDLAAIMVTYPSTHGAYEDTHHRALRDRARPRRPGVRRRRQPQRAARLRQAGRVRRRRLPPQPAQDVLHPARRRRSRRRPGRGARAPRAVPALAPAAPRRRRSARASARSARRRTARRASCRSRGPTSG